MLPAEDRFAGEALMTTDAGGAASSERAPEQEVDELVELLRELIRIRSVNPPGAQGSATEADGTPRTDGELVAARYIERILAAVGVPSTVVEPFPGRGAIVARLHGDGTGGDPLLLMSHLDVVPADPASWHHDPFAGDVADGYVWGRGAIDMKPMVAMEIQILRRLARRAREAGLDPASDPIPGLRRDVIFCCAPDEEAGGIQGANWLVENHPEWLHAAAALNELGGMPLTYSGVRFVPIQVAEKGLAVYKIRVHGIWGHGSVPTDDNAAVLAARVITRISEPGPPRLTSTLAATMSRALPYLPARAAVAARGLESGHAAAVEETVRELCDPLLARTVSALIRDTVSVGVVKAGLKHNVIPGLAEIEVDCRILPGTDEPAMRAELRRRIGEELWARLDVECEVVGPAAEAPLDGSMYPLLEEVVRDHDPEAVPIPFMAPWATDAKHLARIGVPTYGFSPLLLGEGESFLRMLHADDERVGLEALRWGLPVLYDVVARFCL
jgi:acetylornithine deacetylase/succinyl-diaminopimelate desuccinylase-like protein